MGVAALTDSETRAAFSRRAVLDAVAGGLAGAVSRVAVGPLDVVKIRMQVQLEPVRSGISSKYTGLTQALNSIVREEGVRGLWRGTTPALFLTVPYCAVQFAVLHKCKTLVAAHSHQNSPWSRTTSFVSGAAAGAAATLASYPFDLLRTVLASQGSPPLYRGMMDAAADIVRERGVRGLFSGVGITLVEIMPYAGIQFGAYDHLSALSSTWLQGRAAQGAAGALHPSSPLVQAGQHFLVGLAAGIIGKAATHPLDVVKKRYQVAGVARSLAYGARVPASVSVRGVATAVQGIAAREGLAGFYKGLGPSLVKAAPASAITFMAYEFFIGLLLGSMKV